MPDRVIQIDGEAPGPVERSARALCSAVHRYHGIDLALTDDRCPTCHIPVYMFPEAPDELFCALCDADIYGDWCSLCGARAVWLDYQMRDCGGADMHCAKCWESHYCAAGEDY